MELKYSSTILDLFLTVNHFPIEIEFYLNFLEIVLNTLIEWHDLTASPNPCFANHSKTLTTLLKSLLNFPFFHVRKYENTKKKIQKNPSSFKFTQ